MQRVWSWLSTAMNSISASLERSHNTVGSYELKTFSLWPSPFSHAYSLKKLWASQYLSKIFQPKYSGCKILKLAHWMKWDADKSCQCPWFDLGKVYAILLWNRLGVAKDILS